MTIETKGNGFSFSILEEILSNVNLAKSGSYLRVKTEGEPELSRRERIKLDLSPTRLTRELHTLARV